MRFHAIVALAVAVAACSDSSSPNDSSLSFNYSGAGEAGASFEATGTIPANLVATQSFGTTTWAAGTIDASSGATIIDAAIPKTSTAWDVTEVSVTRTTAGTSPIDPTCDSNQNSCTGVFVFFGLEPDNSNFDNFQFGCTLTTGSVTITSITTTNIAGTFTGTGSCINSIGTESPFSVTNGTFNVAVTSQFLAG